MKNKNFIIYITIIGSILLIMTSWGWSNLIKEEYINGIKIYYIDTRQYLNNINNISNNIINSFIDIVMIPDITFSWDIVENVKTITNLIILIINLFIIFPIRELFEIFNAIGTLIGLNPENDFMQWIQSMSNIIINYL